MIGRNTPDAADNESRLLNPANAGQGRLDAANDWVRNNLALSPYSGLNTIEDASFVRLRELSLSYSVDQILAARLGLNSMTIAVSGKNLWTSTNYSGIDPETNAISGNRGGLNSFLQSIDAFGVPIPRIWNLSIKVGL